MNEILGWFVGTVGWGIIGFLFCHFIVTFYEHLRTMDTKLTETEEFLRKDAYYKATFTGAAIFAIVWLTCHVKP